MECISVGVPVRSSSNSVPHPEGMVPPEREKPITLPRVGFVVSINPASPAAPPEAAVEPFRDPSSIVILQLSYHYLPPVSYHYPTIISYNCHTIILLVSYHEPTIILLLSYNYPTIILP